MAFDGIFTHAMTAELNNTLASGRITKIYQPYPSELVLTIRANRKNKTLLLSTHPNYARIQITKEPLTNPSSPSNFVMSLRKHLDGGIIKKFEQLENDRVINIYFSHRNELGDEEDLILSTEIMGRRSNIILYESNTKKIIDTIKHISADQNRYRLLLPGAEYVTPPSQDKVNPFDDDVKSVIKDLKRQFPNFEVLAQNIQKELQGFGKESALELAYRIVKSEKSTDEVLDNFLNEVDTARGYTFSNAKNKLNFLPVKPSYSADNVEEYDALSDMLDQFYAKKARQDRVQQRGAQLIHTVRHELKKNVKKLKKLEKTLDATKYADDYRIKGEILTTYLSQVKRGMTEITLPNFYDDNKDIKISLSNQLSPSKNAQKYFSKYQKEKNAVIFVGKQIKITKDEINFLSNIESQIELAEPEDLDEIKLELEQEGYLKVSNKTKKKNRNKRIVSKPAEFVLDNGTKILVGKNDTQNDRLTFKTAKKDYIWLHVKDMPGSHVIIEALDPDMETITKAAQIAAYYSKGQDADKVPVDYVKVRNIRKPNGSKPGFVVYEGQKNIKVTPSNTVK